MIPLENSSRNLLVITLIAGLFYLLGQYIASAPQRISQEQEARREIAVEGRGEVTARPDIASITLGVQTGVQPTADAATRILTTRFNAVAKAVKDKGIKEEDIKTTNLSINPVYDFQDGRQTLRGFEASESIELKIRNLDTIGEVLASSTGEGVNQVGGLNFTIDDPTALEEQATAAAIKDAQQKAEELADVLNVNIGRVKTFSKNTQGPPQPPIFAEAALNARDAAADKAVGPTVPSGSQDIVVNVTVTYELR